MKKLILTIMTSIVLSACGVIDYSDAEAIELSRKRLKERST